MTFNTDTLFAINDEQLAAYALQIDCYLFYVQPIEEQVYYDPEYDMNEGTQMDLDDEIMTEDDLWHAAGCPSEEDISEFFARQRCD